MNIILIGFKACGKTTIGKELAKSIKKEFIDLDSSIESIYQSKHGTSLQFRDIYKKHGSEYFRSLETGALEILARNNDLVISLGGGTVLSSKNQAVIRSLGKVIYLDVEPSVLWERVSGSKELPAFIDKNNPAESFNKTLKDRKLLYSSIADITLRIKDETPRQVVNRLADMLKKPLDTRVCITFAAKSVDEAVDNLRVAENLNGLTELRLDLINGIEPNNLEKLLKSKSKHIIVTCRTNNINSESKRISMLKKAAELGADYIDIELDSGKEAILDITENRFRSKIIVSYHNFKETPKLEELEKVYESIQEFKPYMAKIVCHANSINDNFTIFELLKNKTNLAAFCMGLKGQISRILAKRFNSRLTFACLNTESAPGQITFAEMEKYNFSLTGKETKLIGVIGKYAENSKSKYMHNAMFRDKGINAVYMPLKMDAEEVPYFICNLRKYCFIGASVTVPHKEMIMKYLDCIDDTAKEIGAVNTIINNEGVLTGYNTDYYGAIMALKEKTELKGKQALVLGAGGAAKAIIFGLVQEDAKVTIVNRTLERAKILAEKFKVQALSSSMLKQLITETDILINATSIGMKPNDAETPFPAEYLIKGKIVMDIVYAPVLTRLIRDAQKNGCITVTGDRMLVHQAMRQFMLWSGKEPDFNLMENALSKGG